jgi:folate-dependent tRNA-U54 methylase TrmFO/GidA
MLYIVPAETQADRAISTHAHTTTSDLKRVMGRPLYIPRIQHAEIVRKSFGGVHHHQTTINSPKIFRNITL